jgi:hypothetical protein
MKKLLLKAVAVCALLLPLQTVDAKTFGQTKSGQKFKMTVTDKISASAGISGNDTNAPVPKGIPNFKKGQKVTFKISKKGAITAKGMSIAFLNGDNGLNNYFQRVNNTDGGNVGVLEFDASTKKPNRLVLNFVKRSGSGLSSKVNTVTYTFN